MNDPAGHEAHTVHPIGLPARSEAARHWSRLDPAVVFLNHGSFGAAPDVVLDAQQTVRDRFEREPVRFVVEELEGLLDEAREEAARFVGCDSEGFAFVTNATVGVNTVVRSLRLEPGDELLTNDHEYNACSNALQAAAERAGARVVRITLPFPPRTDGEMVEAVLGGVTERTRLVLISHVTSPTGLVLPVERIVAALNERGVDAMVDGAHAPGMLALEEGGVDRIGAAYYTGNFHKWVCAPKGSAFLHVRRDKRAGVRPLVISHGANATRADRSRFRLEFDWTGSADPSAWLATPAAIRFMASLDRAGWEGVRRRNRALALAGRDLLCRAFGTEPPAPDSMIGSMAVVRIPDRRAEEDGEPTRYHDPLHGRLIARRRVQVPVIPFPRPPARYVRISAQLYNTLDEYDSLARAILAETG